MIENEDDRTLARHVVKAHPFNAPEIDAHRESENGNDYATSHWGYGRYAGDSNLLAEDQVRKLSRGLTGIHADQKMSMGSDPRLSAFIRGRLISESGHGIRRRQ